MSTKPNTSTAPTLKLPLPAIESQFKFLEGKILTIIDATFFDAVQRKAAKDLVKKSFSEQIDYIWSLVDVMSQTPATSM